MKKKLLYVVAFLVTSSSLNSQNLLNTNTWTIGSGSVNGFSQRGNNSENFREKGIGPDGNNVILWKAVPDRAMNTDGGWATSYHWIDHNKTYRFVVWLKKTNSDNGITYFGVNSLSNTLYLNGSRAYSPEFFKGDLPELNKWYLLIGYVHTSSYKATVHQGGIYDGATGEKVKSLTDYKFRWSARRINHQAFLGSDRDINDRLYLYAPRLELVNGKEPSVEELIGLDDDTNDSDGVKLIFSYDAAGNQIQSFYCADTSCSSSKKQRKENQKKEKVSPLVIAEDDPEIYEEDNLNVTSLEGELYIYPNPVSDWVTLKIEGSLFNDIHSMKLFDVNSVLIKDIHPNEHITQLDVSNIPVGIYFIHIHLEGGESITKKIIKR